MVPQIIKVEDGRYALTRPTVTTMAASLSPLLTSMKLIIKVEDGRYALTRPTVTTMAASLSPLLTSMKLFGLYFKRGTDAGDQTADEKSRCKWNGFMIHALVVVILVWINVIRMFSVLNNV